MIYWSQSKVQVKPLFTGFMKCPWMQRAHVFWNLCLWGSPPYLFLQIHHTALLFTAHCRLTAAVYTTHSLCIKCACGLVQYWLLHLTTPASHSTDFTDFYIPCRRYSFDQLLLWYDKGFFKHWLCLVFLFVVTSYNTFRKNEYSVFLLVISQIILQMEQAGVPPFYEAASFELWDSSIYHLHSIL